MRAALVKLGRPREYDEAEVLEAVLGVFWRKGFSGATLPELAKAAGITRPSLYTALGDKLSMYLRSLEHFNGALKVQLETSLRPDRPLREGLMAFYTTAVDLYFSGDTPRGCLVFCTAAAEATENPKIRAALASVLEMLDEAFEERFRVIAGHARDRLAVTQAAAIGSAILQSLALRARAGQSRDRLIAIASGASNMLVDVFHEADSKRGMCWI